MEEFEELREEEDDTSELEEKSKGNGSRIYTERYSDRAIDRLKHLIVTFFEQGKKKHFSVLVDGETVVKKTSDGRKFDNYLPYVSEYTKVIEVRMYQGYSFNCNRHQFIINTVLSGIPSGQDPEERIKKAIEEHKKELEHKAVQAELIGNRKKLKKLKKLQKENEGNGFSIDKMTDLVKNAVGIVGQIRGRGVTPIGGIGQETPQPKTEVEIEAVEEDTSFESEQNNPNEKSSKEFKKAQALFKELVAVVGHEGVLQAVKIMNGLCAYPELNKKYKQEIDQLNANKNK